MNENELREDENLPVPTGYKKWLCLYIAIGCFAVGAVLFALAIGLTLGGIKNVGVYLIIASMMCELASISFLNAQKRYATNKACTIIRVLSYVVMFSGLIFVLVGMSLSATQKE